MISYEILDHKFKLLIKVCKETGNYKKLAVAIYILISNLIDEMGIKLGIRSREKEKGENLLDYLHIINNVFQTNLKISIFNESLIIRIRKLENLFLRNKGNIPKNYIKEMVEIFYELRKINIPNVFDKFDWESLIPQKNMNIFSFLSSANSNKKRNSNDIISLIMHNVSIQEKELRSQLSQKFDAQKFEEIIYLKKVKDTLQETNKKKIRIQGSLKENLSYQIIRHDMLKNFVVGVLVISFLFGFSLLIETMYYPYITKTISIFLLLSFGMCIILTFIYWINFKDRRRRL